MTRPRVLYICHNHPGVRPGGAEQYALELHRAMRASGDFDSHFLAKGPSLPELPARPAITPSGLDGGEFFACTDGLDYDDFYGRLWPKTFHVTAFREFLHSTQPDVVHFQHSLFLGYETLRAVRTALPRAPIVYTLHEYLPICHHDGQMLRTVNDQELCNEQTPERCSECFPEISPADFYRRTRFITAQLALVDLFIAPSQFLLERYVDWGIPREKIRLEEYGRRKMEPAPVDPREHRNRFAFFGQLNPYKGADVLLEAMRIVGRQVGDLPERPTLRLHGANLDLQRGRYRETIRGLLEQTGDSVEFAGPYPADQLPGLMREIDWVVVPSIWWENSPLVIQEAFGHGRPVICSDIGGMAEKVRDGVDGLHFRARDPGDLARVLTRGAGDPALWEHLRGGIAPAHDVCTHASQLSSIYTSLLASQRAPS